MLSFKFCLHADYHRPITTLTSMGTKTRTLSYTLNIGTWPHEFPKTVFGELPTGRSLDSLEKRLSHDNLRSSRKYCPDIPSQINTDWRTLALIKSTSGLLKACVSADFYLLRMLLIFATHCKSTARTNVRVADKIIVEGLV